MLFRLSAESLMLFLFFTVFWSNHDRCVPGIRVLTHKKGVEFDLDPAVWKSTVLSSSSG